MRAIRNCGFRVSRLMGIRSKHCLGLLGLFTINQISQSAIKQYSDQPAEQSDQQNQDEDLQIEQYSYQKLEQNNKNDILIFVNFDNYKQEYLENMLETVFRLKYLVDSSYEQKGKQRRLKIFKVSYKTKQEKIRLEQELKVSLDECLFVLKNKTVNQFFNFQIYDFLTSPSYLNKFYERQHKLDHKNCRKFMGNSFSSDMIMVLVKNVKPNEMGDQYNAIKEKVKRLSIMKQYSNKQNMYMIQVNDQFSAEQVGIKNAQNGDCFIYQKTSKYNDHRVNAEWTSDTKMAVQYMGNLLKDSERQLYEEGGERFNRLNIFAENGFYKKQVRKLVEVVVDRNKISKAGFDRLIKTISGVKMATKDHEIQFMLNQKRIKEDADYQIYFKNHEKREQQSNDPRLIYKDTHEYQFNNDQALNVDNVCKFINDAIDEKIPQYYDSQEAPSSRTVSRKVVGSDFDEKILKEEKDQGLMIYSKQCMACHYLNIQYEKVAMDMMDQQDQLQFNRMNQINKLKNYPNFMYTPVMLYFKNQHKKKAYKYSSATIYYSQVHDFFSICKSFQLMEQSHFEEQIQKRKDSESVMDQMRSKIY